MRIAYVVHKFPPESLGGTEIYAWGLARAMARLGHAVSVFYPLANLESDAAHLERDGLHLWRVPWPASRSHEDPARQYWHTFRDRAIEAAFQHFMAETRPEVVHFQHVQWVSAELIRLAAGRPRVATLHDYWYYCANSQLVRPDRRPCLQGPQGGWNCVDCATARADLRRLRWLRPLVALPFAYRNLYLRRVTHAVELFLTPSEFLRQQYIGQGWEAGRIRTIENGLDTERLAGAGSALPPPPARPHFGFLGSLAWQKGVHVLVEAFNRLPSNAALTIYGSGAAFPEYAAQVAALARHPHIRLAGPLDYRHVGDALRDLDCLVVPSLWYENSPLVIQEAYGVGLPVVASRLGALAEKVRDGQTGRLFVPGDSADLARVLGELIADPASLQRFRAQIRPAPDMDEHARKVMELYQALNG